MNRKLAIIIGLQAFLIIFLFWVLVFYGKDEYEALTQTSEEEIETPNHVSTQQNRVVVTLNPQTQVQSDIKTVPLKASANRVAGNRNYGSVVTIDQLLELRTRYLAALAEAEILSATLTSSKSEFNRLKTLNEDNKNVSDKVVTSAQTMLKADEVKIAAARNNAKNIANSMRQYWGDRLTQEATSQQSGAILQNLIDHKDVLLQITLPFNATEPKVGSSISISPVAANATTYSAKFISSAPISNTTLQGKTYFYTAKAPDLRAGMQVSALDGQQKKGNVQGVIIPNSAVVWYGGKPWVYRKSGADQFSRLPISADIETDNGWFYVGNLKPNDLVVTSGAQLLLSEEFKYQITNENDD